METAKNSTHAEKLAYSDKSRSQQALSGTAYSGAHAAVNNSP